MDKNIVWHSGNVNYDDRCKLLEQKGQVLWFTGLSGSGKSTVAVALEKALINRGKLTYRLDGDNVRHGLNSDLGFTDEDRDENIRRIAEVSKLFKDAGVITLVSFISPFRSLRDFAKNIVGPDSFSEIYVKCSVEECKKRDPKGLYKKAVAGEIKNFTGISSAYEEPENPRLVIDTTNISVEEAVEQLLKALEF